MTQTRTFNYNVNQQLASTQFPDVLGTTTYAYNLDGTLATKSDYKGVRKYFYTNAKQLERVERWPGGSAEDMNARVNYYYDTHPLTTTFTAQYTQGRLAAISYGVGTGVREFYSYTRGGKLVKKRLEMAGSWKLEVGFEYDSTGKMQFMVYPSGKRVKYTYDDLQRHTGLKDVQGSTETDLVTNLTYGASGELKTMAWTGWAGNGSQNWTYNNRLQMTNYTYTGTGGPVNQEYKYSATANDGKLWRKKDHVSGEEVEYQYDSIHRLTSASVLAGTLPAGQEWGQTYTYDGFGNMKQKQGLGAATGTSFNNLLISATNNRPAAGDPGDMENRIKMFNGEGYTYAADNKRLSKVTITGVEYWYLWVGGMRVGTYRFVLNGGTGQLDLVVVKEDVYAAGRRVAPSDRLGSDLSGGVRLMPYGSRTKFATYYRDATGLDYADQRYYNPGSGRFMTADPYQSFRALQEPNGWNRYAYVIGDPINLYDPEGLDYTIPNGGTFNPGDPRNVTSGHTSITVGIVGGPPGGIVGGPPGGSMWDREANDNMYGETLDPNFDPGDSKGQIQRALQDCYNAAINTFTSEHNEWMLNNPQPQFSLLPSIGDIVSQVGGAGVGWFYFGGTVGATVGGAAIGFIANSVGKFVDATLDWMKKQAPIWEKLSSSKEECYKQFGPTAYPWAWQ